jgi:hypothetical protein
MCGSLTVLCGCWLSSFGVCVPVLALKSPQMMVVSWGWELSIMSSMFAVASASVMFLRFRDCCGGRYTFIMFTRWLLGSVSFTYWQYSFPYDASISNYFFMYIAIPPRVPLVLLYSIRLYPAICGGIAACDIQVSYTHKMSNSIYASIMYIFRYVSPRMLILPTLTPCVIHVLRLEFSDLFLLRDPFVLRLFADAICSFIVLFFLQCSFCACCPFNMGGAGGIQAGRALAGPMPVLGMMWRVNSHEEVLGVAARWGYVFGWSFTGPISIGFPVIGGCLSVLFRGCS